MKIFASLSIRQDGKTCSMGFDVVDFASAGLIWFKRDWHRICDWLKLKLLRKFAQCFEYQLIKLQTKILASFVLIVSFCFSIFRELNFIDGNHIQVIEFYAFLHVIFNRNKMESWYCLAFFYGFEKRKKDMQNMAHMWI